MAAQAALIADTITGMKRALRRERDGKLTIELLAFEAECSLTSSLDRQRPGRPDYGADESWQQNAC
jgi:hypothetical protein